MNGRDYAARGDPGRSAFVDIDRLVARDVRPDEIPELRHMWWDQAALGHRLPAELEIIVIMGGRQ